MTRDLPANQQPYRHQALGVVNEIRLLAILPGPFNYPIRCTLTAVCLDDDPAYDALSYTWGSLVTDETLICDGQILQVTLNLHEGLRRLRRRRSVRVVWVDAVCINQDDVAERNQQILYMTRIFRDARQVVIWLGETSDKYDLLPLSAITKRDWVFTTESKHARQLPRSWLQHFNRPWFQRV